MWVKNAMMAFVMIMHILFHNLSWLNDSLGPVIYVIEPSYVYVFTLKLN